MRYVFSPVVLVFRSGSYAFGALISKYFFTTARVRIFMDIKVIGDDREEEPATQIKDRE